MGEQRFIGRMGMLAMTASLILGMAASPSAAASADSHLTLSVAPNTPSPGYQLIAADGGVFNENTPFFGSLANAAPLGPVVGGAPTASGNGYWLVDATGTVTTFGDALTQGSLLNPPNKPVVGMTADPATGGYWLVASDGGVFAFNAPFEGSTGNLTLNKPVVGMAADPATGGYWLVASDGGVFAFNAPFEGSTGNLTLNKPVVGMVPTTAGPLAPACTTSQLSITGQGTQGGLSHDGFAVLFTNDATTCSLVGYPAIRGEATGGGVTFTATPTPSGYLGGINPGVAPSPVTLSVGQTASALFEGIDGQTPGNTCAPSTTRMSVTPPNNTQSVSLAFLGSYYCSPQLIHPVVPGTSGGLL